MDTINYTEQEQKQIVLLKAWVKLSNVGGNFGKQATETFSKDWIKLQEDFVDRLGLLGGRVYINKTMDLIEDYIKADEVEEVKPKEPKKKIKFVVKNIDWVWCCGNKIPKDMEAVGCSYCF